MVTSLLFNITIVQTFKVQCNNKNGIIIFIPVAAFSQDKS